MGFDATARMVRSLREGAGSRPYATTAEVSRIDEAGVVWVRLPNSEGETPCHASNAACSPGDTVDVAVSHRDTHITGNRSRPATDDEAARAALQDTARAWRLASAADAAAGNAAARAGDALSAAADAKAVADGVAQTAADALAQAGNAASAAQASAARADEAARVAESGLARVEDVVGTANWLAEHARPTGDETAMAGKDYYMRDEATGTLTQADVQPGQSVAGLWELTESVRDYIASYLALVDGTLKLSSGGAARVELSSEAMRFYAADGNVVASIEVGADGKSVMRITRSVVLEDMQFSSWKWYSRRNGNMSLKWVG